MKADPLFKDKYIDRDGAMREMVIWRLPAVDPERAHGLKYRLYYGKNGRCLVRHDNAQGKGDQRHCIDEEGSAPEEAQAWVLSVQQRIADFKADIEQHRGEPP